MIIRTIAFPRAALVGNPSDGYHGRTIAFVFRNYQASVELYETPELELMPAKRDHNVFSCIDALCADVSQYGYYGGIRLLKAAVKTFGDFCHRERIQLEKKNFTIRYSGIGGVVGDHHGGDAGDDGVLSCEAFSGDSGERGACDRTR